MALTTPRAAGGGDFRRTIRTAVVGDDDFPGHAKRLQGLLRLIQAAGKCPGLVEAGDEQGQCEVVILV